MESSNASVAVGTIGCHRCGAEAGIRFGKEFLCGSCAIQDLRTEPEPPVVLCDFCHRESTLRLDERFLCGRCVLALLCLDGQDEPELLRGFASALASAIVGQREPAIAWAWEIGKRTRDGGLTVAQASAVHHRALAELVRVSQGTEERAVSSGLVEAAASLFATYASSLDGYLEGLRSTLKELREREDELSSTGDDLRRERDELVHRLRRAEEQRAALIRHITAAKEEERGRIAEEIHDDPVQMLVALQMRLQVLQARSGEGAAEVLGELSRATAASIGRLRTLMFGLRSDLLEAYGLVGTLRELLARTEEQFDVRFRLDDGLHAEPPSDVGINLYRVAQEAITNVRKHARASAVDVCLEECDDGVLMTVVDDGTGFEAGEEPGTDHAGMCFMRDRAARAGGWVDVESEPGTGTTVRCWIPSHVEGR